MMESVKPRIRQKISNILEALFYAILIICIIASITGTVRFFVLGNSKVTNLEENFFSAHSHPGILFFGPGFELNICRNFNMTIGNSGFVELLERGTDCIYQDFEITFYPRDLLYWDPTRFEGTDLGNFAASIIQLLELPRPERNQTRQDYEHMMKMMNDSISINGFLIKGPSRWRSQDTIYINILSEKTNNALHPYYLIPEFEQVLSSMERISHLNTIREPVNATAAFAKVVEERNLVYRYMPTEAFGMVSMFKEEFKEDGETRSSRITIEQTAANVHGKCHEFEHQFNYLDPEAPRSEPKEQLREFFAKMCNSTGQNGTYSESTFRWFDGMVKSSNTFDAIDPWTIFGSLVSVTLALDRLFCTVMRYWSARKDKKIDVESVLPMQAK